MIAIVKPRQIVDMKNVGSSFMKVIGLLDQFIVKVPRAN
jgi:hypothetical protein